MKNLDVLVVYSSKLAISAAVSDLKSKFPFNPNSKTAGYNLPYSYFLQACKKFGMSAGFSTSSDVIGPGACQTFWTTQAGEWKKVRQEAHSSHIFDKISPSSPKRVAERKLLLSTKKVRSFNHQELHSMFFDKLLTYTRLPQYSLPTVTINDASISAIKSAIQNLQTLIKQHPHAEDFKKAFVLKDRFGASGNHVYAVETNFVLQIQKLMNENPSVQFILQPFLHFDKGFSYNGIRTTTDVRLIFHHNKIVQSYIRLAQGDDFRCNEHQGGELIYVTKRDIPSSILKRAKIIVSRINRPHSLYALDFIVSNSGNAYLLEGNFGPGLDWDLKKKINEKMSKNLIDSIVDEFANRIKNEGSLVRN